MSLNHLILGGKRDVDLDVKSLAIMGIPVDSNISSGTYSPSFIELQNAVVNSSFPATYSRIGNIATITGRYQITPGTVTNFFTVGLTFPLTEFIPAGINVVSASGGGGGSFGGSPSWVITAASITLINPIDKGFVLVCTNTTQNNFQASSTGFFNYSITYSLV